MVSVSKIEAVLYHLLKEKSRYFCKIDASQYDPAIPIDIPPKLTYALFLYVIQKILYYRVNPVIPIISFTFIELSTYYLLCYSDTVTKLIPEETRMVLKTISMVSIMLIYTLFVCKGKLMKKIQVFLILNLSIFVVEAIQSICYVTIFDFSASEFRHIDLKTKVITGSISIFFYCLVAIFTYFICKHREIKIEPKIFAVLTSLFLLIAFLYVLVMASTVHSTSLLTSVLSIFSAFTVMALMLILCRIMIQANNQEVLKEKLFWSENVQQLQLSYYNNLNEKTKEIRQVRHDIKDQLETVKKLVNKNTDESIEAANDILKKELEDGVKTEDIAVFVRHESPRYIRKFQKVKAGKLSWNWGAFFFAPYWFFFRKLHKLGVIFLALFILLSSLSFLPSAMKFSESLYDFEAQAGELAENIENEKEYEAEVMKLYESVYTELNENKTGLIIFTTQSLANLVISVFIGLNTDKWYYKHTLSQVRKASDETEKEKHREKLFLTGGVAYGAAFLAILFEKAVFYGLEMLVTTFLK